MSRTRSTKSLCSSWAPDTLTCIARCDAVGTALCHVASWRQACSSTQSPSGTMSPDSSATRMKRSGLDRAPLDMCPPAQRLHRTRLPRAQIEDGLVGEVEVLLLDRAPERALEPELRRHLCMQCGVEHGVLRAALRLGTVHCDVGVTHYILGRLVFRAAHRDTDAHAGRYLRRADLHRLADDRLQARGECDGILLAHAAREDSKLVAAEPRDNVRGPKLRRDAPPEHNEKLVAYAVAKAVVDGLESVAVEEQHGEAKPRVLARGLDGASELLEEVRSVRKVG